MDTINCLCGKKYVSPFCTELIKTWIICNKKNYKGTYTIFSSKETNNMGK
jgi:hypothetical protein